MTTTRSERLFACSSKNWARETSSRRATWARPSRPLTGAGVDVVLLDWELPQGGYAGGTAAEFVRESKQRAPGCRMIAMSGRPESRGESLRAGCDAFVSKNDPPDRLLALLGVGRELSG